MADESARGGHTGRDLEIERLLSALDHPVPGVTADDVRTRSRRIPPGRGRPHRSARAAGLVLAMAVGAGIAYAAPGSPVPAWIVEVGQALGIVGTKPESGPDREADHVGLSVPVDEPLVIDFVADERGGWVRVGIVEGVELSVRSPAGSTRFVSEPGSLVVEHATPDTLILDVPATAEAIRVRVGSRPVWSLVGGRIEETTGPSEDGSWLIPLGPGG